MYEKKERLKKALGRISENCAFVKFNGNEVEYIRIDDKYFYDSDTMGEEVIAYTRKMREACDKVLEMSEINQHGVHISKDIFKYHPQWIGLREMNGLTPYNEGEEPCETKLIKTYDEWFHYEFIAAGLNCPRNQRVKPETRIDYKVFESTCDFDGNEPVSVHPDFFGFNAAMRIVHEVQEYKNAREENKPNKQINNMYQGVKYEVSEEGFPIIIVGPEKTAYDFRYGNAKEKCEKHIEEQYKQNKQKKRKPKKKTKKR